MTFANAIKKLERAGYKVEPVQGYKYQATTVQGYKYQATKEGSESYIEFFDQNDHIICIDLRRKGVDDELESDYHSGTFCRNLSQAIRWAKE